MTEEGPRNLEDTYSSDLSEAYFLSFDSIEFKEIERITGMFHDYSEQSEEYNWLDNPDLTVTISEMLEETGVGEFDTVQAYSLDGEKYNFFSTVSEEGLYVIGDGSVQETFRSIYSMADRKFI